MDTDGGNINDLGIEKRMKCWFKAMQVDMSYL